MNYIKLDENEIMINELNNKNDWKAISKLNLCEEDLLKYKNKLHWDRILQRHDFINLNLLEQLIDEGILNLKHDYMKYKLCFHIGSKSLEFVKKYKYKLGLKKIIEYCGFDTKELAQLIIIKPKIGMGVTYITNNNLFPYTIIKVNKFGNEIQIQKDKFELTEGSNYLNQNYKITPDLNGEIFKVTLRKNGDWGVVNSSSTVFLGNKQCYINPDFI